MFPIFIPTAFPPTSLHSDSPTGFAKGDGVGLENTGARVGGASVVGFAVVEAGTTVAKENGAGVLGATTTTTTTTTKGDPDGASGVVGGTVEAEGASVALIVVVDGNGASTVTVKVTVTGALVVGAAVSASPGTGTGTGTGTGMGTSGSEISVNPFILANTYGHSQPSWWPACERKLRSVEPSLRRHIHIHYSNSKWQTTTTTTTTTTMRRIVNNCIAFDHRR